MDALILGDRLVEVVVDTAGYKCSARLVMTNLLISYFSGGTPRSNEKRAGGSMISVAVSLAVVC